MLRIIGGIFGISVLFGYAPNWNYVDGCNQFYTFDFGYRPKGPQCKIYMGLRMAQTARCLGWTDLEKKKKVAQQEFRSAYSTPIQTAQFYQDMGLDYS